jgi:predicted  nucleic acid-binding Zn-ribbon protein
METHIKLLYKIEDIEVRIHGAPIEEAEELVRQLERLIGELPTSLREQYEWLRSWTRYPIARLRQGSCTGCGASYDREHAFVRASASQVTYCEHCLRILLLNDLELVA